MKPWFRRFKRAVELHCTGSTVHTSRADACADCALIAFSSSPSFYPAANSVARAFTSCAVSLGSLPELPSSSSSYGYALRLGPIRALQKGGLTRPSHCCPGRFSAFSRKHRCQFWLSFSASCRQRLGPSRAVLQPLHLSASPSGAPSGRTETGTSEPLCCQGCSSLLVAVVLEDVEAWGPFHCSRMLHLLQVGGPTHSCRTPQSSLPQDLVWGAVVTAGLDSRGVDLCRSGAGLPCPALLNSRKPRCTPRLMPSTT